MTDDRPSRQYPDPWMRPHGLPQYLNATCPAHGLQRFEWLKIAYWWMCPKFGNNQEFGEPSCFAVITERMFMENPDGGDAVNLTEDMDMPSL